jgi:AhpD family alkylhydroperoxidase
MASSIDEFRKERERMNDKILSADHQGIKRFFRLDAAAYERGALPSGTKELLGLAVSTALRCNDCIDYHLIQCVKEGYSDQEILEALNVALIIGGSIVIPHLRHAYANLEDLRKET